MILSNRLIFLLLQFLLLTYTAEYDTNECKEVGNECTIRSVKNVVDASDGDFAEFSEKVKIIDSSYGLVNTSLRNMPRSRLLKMITGNLTISGNKYLIYDGELDRLERVAGSVFIQNNPLFRLPRSLYEQLCQQREGSKCSVDVTCKGDLFFNGKTKLYTESYAQCTVLYGDIVVHGLKVDKYSSKMPSFPFNIHTVYGAVRIIQNEIENFGFMQSLKRIEYPYDAGCALSVLSNQGMHRLGLTNMEKIVLHSNSASSLCLMKNRMANENTYYSINTDKADQQTFTRILNSTHVVFDNDTGCFEWGLKKQSYQTAIFTLRIASGVMAGCGILVYLLWGMDCKLGIIFYKEARDTTVPVQKKEPTLSTNTVSEGEDEMEKEYKKLASEVTKFGEKYVKKNRGTKLDTQPKEESNTSKSQYATMQSQGRSNYIKL